MIHPSYGKLVKRRESSAKLGDGVSTNYEKEAKGLIPPGIPLGPKTVVWPESEIDVIVQARVAGLSDDDIRRVVAKLVEQRNRLRDELLQFISGDAPGVDPSASPASPTSPAVERLLKGRERAKMAATQEAAP